MTTNIIESGKYGITRKQMVPAIKNAYKEENKVEIIDKLYKDYKDIFIQSVKYLPLDIKNFITEKYDLSINNIVNFGKYGITKTQMLFFLKTNVDNVENIKAAFTDFPVLSNGCIRYLNKDEKEKIINIINNDLDNVEDNNIDINETNNESNDMDNNTDVNEINDNIITEDIIQENINIEDDNIVSDDNVENNDNIVDDETNIIDNETEDNIDNIIENNNEDIIDENIEDNIE